MRINKPDRANPEPFDSLRSLRVPSQTQEASRRAGSYNRIAGPLKTLHLSAPAKVNLFLRVLGKRKDGYHSIETVFHAVGLFDEIRLSPAPRLRLTVNGLPSPRGPGNLCWRAAELLKKRCGVRAGAHIRLRKRIPSGAGLGGGSSDAAACLAGLNRMWKPGLSRRELMRLAAKLGSDVPFFLLGSASAIGRGRGERLTPLKSRLHAYAVILKPRFSIPTGPAYRALDRMKRRASPAEGLALTSSAVRRGDLTGLSAFNDFEAVAARTHPEIDRLIVALRQAGAMQAFMSGSGSAVVGLFRSAATARKAAGNIRKGLRVTCWVVKLPQ